MRRIVILLIGFFVILAALPAPQHATQASPVPQLPRPHLGYGIHVAPYAGGGNPLLVNQLQMDWVKLYEPFQIEQYPDKKILFRMDFGWPNDWNQFRVDARARILELNALGVDAIEVHNEPNLYIEWPRGSNAAEYVQMLRVVYAEIKAVNPAIVVVSGGLAPTGNSDRSVDDLLFARQMFDLGAGDYFDVFGYHPYGFNAPPEEEPAPDRLNFRRVELIRDLMVEYNLDNKQIWLTEFGWLRNPSEDGIACSASDPQLREFVWMQVDGQTQADYIVRAYDFADRYWEWVGPTFLWNLNWSQLPLEALSPCNHMRWFSLLNSRGEPTLAFNTVARMDRRPAELSPEMTLASDAMTVEVGETCLGVVQVGQFTVQNTGYPGEFEVDVLPAVSFSGPVVFTEPSTAEIGDTVRVYADTTDLTTGLYIVYINAQTTIAGRRISQTLEGYVIVSESFAACQ